MPELHGDKHDALVAELLDLSRQLDAMAMPVAPRMIVDDCSPERLATLMAVHEGRIGAFAPEGDVFDQMAGRYSATGMPNLAVYLRGHAGDSLRVDRVSRSPEFVQKPALTMGLAVQPESLHGIMRRRDFWGRGLLGRFLYSIPRSPLGHRDVDAPPVPDAVAGAYRSGVLQLLGLVGGTDEAGLPCPHELVLDARAQELMRDYQKELEPRLGQYCDLGHMADWAGKLAGAVGRIAGILHVADRVGTHAPWQDPVDVQTVRRAIAIGCYLTYHALAAYGAMGGNPEVESARYLWGWIERSGLTAFSKRQAFEWSKGRFKRVAALEPALALLVEHGFIRVSVREDRAGPGRRRSPTFEVNPYAGRAGSHNSQNEQNQVPAEDSANSANSASHETPDGRGGPDGR